MMARFLRLVARAGDHWLGDVLGAVGLFALGWLLLFIGHGMGL